jgi:hypothetical protein
MIFFDSFCCSISQKAMVGFPGFPVEFGGVGAPHAAFLTEAAHVAVGECHVAGNPGRPSYSAHVRWGVPWSYGVSARNGCRETALAVHGVFRPGR